MNNRRKSSLFKNKEQEKKRLIMMIAIPVIILMLIIIIVRIDQSETPQEEIPIETTQAVVETQAQIEETKVAPAFFKESHPAIITLLETYFDARANANVEKMNEVYGVVDASEEQLETLKTSLWVNSKYIEKFTNVTTYMKEGVQLDDWLVYAVADISFHGADTVAPMVMWCYVKTSENGSFYICRSEELSTEELAYVEQINKEQEVLDVATAVTAQLKTALLEDEALNTVYGVLNSGSPIWTGEAPKPEEVKIIETQAE